MSHDSIIEQNNDLSKKQPQLNIWLDKLLNMPWSAELIMAGVVSLVIGALFSIYARGGPNSSDVTLYINVGMRGIADPFILNRYFHVFLQAIFIWLAPHPLVGYHLLWGFIVGVNAFLIYISARKTLKHSNVFHGLLAVILFFSLSGMVEMAGVVVVDFTAMTMIMAIFAVYLFSVNRGHKNPWMIAILGVLFFLGFKTKESTIPVAVLFLGLGWVGDAPFQWKVFVKNLLWVGCGILGGIVIFALLSGIFLGDPLFGLRFSDWQGYLGTYIGDSPYAFDAVQERSEIDWFHGYFLTMAFLPFFLYVLSGISLDPDTRAPRRLLWLAPLSTILFLVFSINNRFGYDHRFALATLPLLCVLAPQFLRLEMPESGRKRNLFMIYLGIGIGIMLLVRLLMQLAFPADLYDRGAIVNLILYPVLLSVFFIALFLVREKWLSHLIAFIAILSMLLSPFVSNLRAFFITRRNEVMFAETVLPFTEFEDQIQFHPDMRFYLVNKVFLEGPVPILKNVDEALSMFNILFDVQSTRGNFWYVEYPPDIAGNIMRENFDYALLTIEDWEAIQRDTEKAGPINARYQPHFGDSGQFVLLVGNP